MTAKRHIHSGDQLAWLHDQPEAALAEYRKALESDTASDTDLATAQIRIGQVHFFAPTPRTAEAIAAFREAVRLEMEGSEARYWLGLALAQQKQYKEAIGWIKEAIIFSEMEDERLYISLGKYLYEDGKYTQAVKAYQDGIRVSHHEEAGYYLMLADAFHASKQTKRACSEWKRVLALRSGCGEEDELWKEARAKIAAHCRG